MAVILKDAQKVWFQLEQVKSSPAMGMSPLEVHVGIIREAMVLSWRRSGGSGIANRTGSATVKGHCVVLLIPLNLVIANQSLKINLNPP